MAILDDRGVSKRRPSATSTVNGPPDLCARKDTWVGHSRNAKWVLCRGCICKPRGYCRWGLFGFAFHPRQRLEDEAVREKLDPTLNRVAPSQPLAPRLQTGEVEEVDKQARPGDASGRVEVETIATPFAWCFPRRRSSAEPSRPSTQPGSKHQGGSKRKPGLDR